jgi:3-dehydroquinate synthase
LERVTVAVPGRVYDVTIGSGVLDAAGEHLPDLPNAERAFVVADHVVAGRYLAQLSAGLAATGLEAVHLGVPAGEEAKSLQVMSTLQRQLAVQEAHRHDPVVALGGGAVGDLAGFVASTYMRGVPFVQVPTTLTAQVDAAIGGKTAVNLPEGKNLVGAFYQPRAVLADVTTLASLSEREFRSGLAEVAKYALTLDTSLLDLLEADLPAVLAREPAVLEDLVARCVRAKAGVVARDERDTGARLILNYGHTLGHALERLDAFAGRSHGEAISVGMVFAARLAESLGLAAAGLVARHARLLASLGLEPEGALPGADAIWSAMRLDKKYAGGVRFVLLEEVGRPRVEDDVPEDAVRAALAEMGTQG